jgi:hypothetical protein
VPLLLVGASADVLDEDLLQRGVTDLESRDSPRCMAARRMISGSVPAGTVSST